MYGEDKIKVSKRLGPIVVSDFLSAVGECVELCSQVCLSTTISIYRVRY